MRLTQCHKPCQQHKPCPGPFYILHPHILYIDSYRCISKNRPLLEIFLLDLPHDIINMPGSCFFRIELFKCTWAVTSGKTWPDPVIEIPSGVIHGLWKILPFVDDVPMITIDIKSLIVKIEDFSSHVSWRVNWHDQWVGQHSWSTWWKPMNWWRCFCLFFAWFPQGGVSHSELSWVKN